MFKINRRSITKTSSNFAINRAKPTQYSSLSKSILNKSFKDYGRHLNKLSTQKINSFKRLTKQNIKQLQLKRIKAKADLNNALKNAAEKQQLDNKNIIYKNSVLPAIPDYIPVSQKQQNTNNDLPSDNDISKLPKRTIQTPEDMANLFNQIMNGTGQIPQIQEDGTIKYDQNAIKTNNNQQQHIKNFQDIRQYIPEILDKIKTTIIDDKRIQYIKYIQTICTLYSQFSHNNMIKSIILRSLQKINRQQLFKIPSDKLQDLITLVLKYLV